MTKDKSKNFFRVSAEDFKKIPGSPIAYWTKKNFFINLMQDELLGTKSYIKTGMTTAENDLFLRFWYEVSFYVSVLAPVLKKMQIYLEKNGSLTTKEADIENGMVLPRLLLIGKIMVLR